MNKSAGGSAVRQLLILLALLVPGGGLFFWGVSACAAAGRFAMPQAAGVLGGLGLVIAGGCYHYLTDYRGERRRGGLAPFLGLAAFSALAAYLVNRVLFR
jgi:hypothetical protein